MFHHLMTTWRGQNSRAVMSGVRGCGFDGVNANIWPYICGFMHKYCLFSFFLPLFLSFFPSFFSFPPHFCLFFAGSSDYPSIQCRSGMGRSCLRSPERWRANQEWAREWTVKIMAINDQSAMNENNLNYYTLWYVYRLPSIKSLQLTTSLRMSFFRTISWKLIHHVSGNRPLFLLTACSNAGFEVAKPRIRRISAANRRDESLWSLSDCSITWSSQIHASTIPAYLTSTWWATLLIEFFANLLSPRYPNLHLPNANLKEYNPNFPSSSPGAFTGPSALSMSVPLTLWSPRD